VTYGYDLTGRMLQASDGSSTTPYTVGYDTAGRANSYTDQEGRNTQVQYDGVGNRTRLQWPANTNGSSAYYVTYQYDAMNRMKEIDQNGSTSTPLAKYQWDLLSRQSLITYGDGTTDAYSSYDAADNLQTLTQTYAGADNAVTFSYTWQKNHQRASTGVSNGIFQYVPTASTTSYGSANADNGYVSMDNSITGSESFTYDGNQNMTFDGVNTLTYDVENRLFEAQNAAWGTSTYLYDPLGHRKQKQVTSGNWVTTTQFVLAGGQEIADYSGTGVGAGTGAVGMAKPSSTTSAAVGAQYLGFIYTPGSSSNSSISWSSHLASFGFTTAALPANCNNTYFGVPAADTNVLFGGDFHNDDPSTSSTGYGNCDVAIDLGTEDSSNYGLYTSAKVYMLASYAGNTTGSTDSFSAVAIAGLINGKYAIFVLGDDNVQPWAIYLLQSN
jgi:YD repeat-containing protein